MQASAATRERIEAISADAKALGDAMQKQRFKRKEVYSLACKARSLARHATCLACLLEKASGGQENA